MCVLRQFIELSTTPISFSADVQTDCTFPLHFMLDGQLVLGELSGIGLFPFCHAHWAGLFGQGRKWAIMQEEEAVDRRASPLGSLPVLLTLPRSIATHPLQFTYWFFSHLTYFIHQRLCRAAFSSSLFGFFSYGGNSLSLSPPPLSSIVCRLGRAFHPPPFMPAPVLFPHSAIAREGNSPNTTATKIFIRYLLSCVWWIVALSSLCRRLHPFRCRYAFKGREKRMWCDELLLLPPSSSSPSSESVWTHARRRETWLDLKKAREGFLSFHFLPAAVGPQVY